MEEALSACARALVLDPARLDARINHATALLALGRAEEARRELEGSTSRRRWSSAASPA
jgi:predicted Zn-dependent protease